MDPAFATGSDALFQLGRDKFGLDGTSSVPGSKPSKLQQLQQYTIIDIACGRNHTAALTGRTLTPPSLQTA